GGGRGPGEVDAAGPRLQLLVPPAPRPGLVGGARGGAGPRPPEKVVQRRPEVGPPLEEFGLGESAAGALEARPAPVPLPGHYEKLRLEAVVVASADRLAPAGPVGEGRDRGERFPRMVVRVCGRGGRARRPPPPHRRPPPSP